MARLHAVRWAAAALAAVLGAAVLLGGGPALAAGENGAAGAPDDPFAGINAVEEYARTHLAGVFAGLYLEGADAGGAGTLVINTAGTLSDQHRQALLDLAGGIPVRFRTVDYPLAELERLQQEITMAMPDLERQGVQIAVVGVDVIRNRVQVTVTGSAGEAAAILGQRFDGSRLEVVTGEPPVLLESAGDTSGEGDGGAASGEDAGAGGGAAERRPGFWQRLLDTIRSWWRALLG